MHLYDHCNFDTMRQFESSHSNSSEAPTPSNPHMSYYQNRCSSFRNWPNHIKTRPEIFAAAGFFYLGQGDRLKCFHCDGVLQKWQDNEDPWFEHAKWYPDCEYLLRCKGTDFVQEISSRFPYINGSSPINNQLLSSCETPPTNPNEGCNRNESENRNSLDLTLNLAAASNRSPNGMRPQIMCCDIASQTASSMSSNKPVDIQKQSFVSTKTKLTSLSQTTKNYIGSAMDKDSKLSDDEIKKRITRMLHRETCKVCLDRKSDCLFAPCKHLCCCFECASSLNYCPLCRKPLARIIKVYRD